MKISASTVSIGVLGLVLAYGIYSYFLYLQPPSGSIDNKREAERTLIGIWTWGEYFNDYDHNYSLSFYPDGTCKMSGNMVGVSNDYIHGMDKMGKKGQRFSTWRVEKDRYIDTHEEYWICRTPDLDLPMAIEISSANSLRITMENEGPWMNQRVVWKAYKKKM